MNKVQSRRPAPSDPSAAATGEQAAMLAAELRALAANIERHGCETWANDAPDLIGYARTVSAARRQLDQVIGTCWLTDPALEVLLAAFVAEAPGASTGSEHAIEAVPHTARRWVAVLAQAGLVTGERPGDMPALTTLGRDTVQRYLRAILAGGLDQRTGRSGLVP